jgi:outer membrane protein assembly factor BamB
VYVGGAALYALDAADGATRWTSHEIGVSASMPAVANGRLFANSEDPNFGLHAFDAQTGALLWRGDPGETLATPTVANGVVYAVADTGELVLTAARDGRHLGALVDPSGHPFDAGTGAQVAVSNGVIYVSTADPSGGNRVDAFGLP